MARSALLLLVLAVCSAELVNSIVTRTVHLDGKNVKSHTVIDVLNKDDEGSEPVQDYYVAINATLESQLIHLEVQQEGYDLELHRAEVRDSKSRGVIGYLVRFNEMLGPQSKTKLTVTEYYSHRKEAFPTTMRIKDVPKVRFHDNAYYLSYYQTQKMKSKFQYPNGGSL